MLDGFKDIEYMRKRVDRLNIFAGLWNTCWELFWLHSTMLTLHIVGIFYFIGRIILYKFGWLTFHVKEKYSWSKRKRKKKKKRTPHHVHNVALNIDTRLQDGSLNFDTDSSTIICDNSANVHICNDKNVFIGDLRRTDQHYVATIGGNKNVAQGMGTVRWRWKDDTGKDHTFKAHNVLHFP